MIDCEICLKDGVKKSFKRLGPHITRIHKITKEEYLIRFPKALLDDPSFVNAMRDLANKNWQDPESVQNSQAYRDNQSKIAKDAYADPESGYHKEGYIERMREGVRESWTEERREEHAELTSERWADPNDSLNSDACLEKMSVKAQERWKNEDYKKSVHTDEAHRKQGLSMKEVWQDPVYRRNQLERMANLTSSKNERRMKRYLSKALRRTIEDDHELLNGIQVDAIDHVAKVVIEWDGPWHRVPIRSESQLNQIRGRDSYVDKVVVSKGYMLIRVCDNTDASEKFCYQKCREILKTMFDADRTPRVVRI
jgi:very-short-patch-repair endonuclease